MHPASGARRSKRLKELQTFGEVAGTDRKDKYIEIESESKSESSEGNLAEIEEENGTNYKLIPQVSIS